MGENDLIEVLCGLLASGRLDTSFVLAALREATKGAAPPPTTAQVLEILEKRPEGAFASLAGHIRARRRLEAVRLHNRRRSGEGDLGEFRDLLGDLPLDAPPAWTTGPALAERVRGALQLQQDLLFLEPLREKAPRITRAVQTLLDQALPVAALGLEPLASVAALEGRPESAAIAAVLSRLRGLIEGEAARDAAQAQRWLSGEGGAFPGGLKAETAAALIERAYSAADGIPGKRRALDAACCWPTSRLAPLIRRMGDDRRFSERAALLLTLRCNEPSASDWPGAAAWLARLEAQDESAFAECEALRAGRPAESLALWCRSRPDLPADLRSAVEAFCRKTLGEIPAGNFASRYASALSPEERRLFGPDPEKAPSPLRTSPTGRKYPLKAVPKAEKSGPSLWEAHLLPFLSENWTMLTGIAMVVAGSSLLAFFTWDKHWIVRYTLLPALLAAFTALLARIGGWTERRDAKLKATADMLRGAGVALLPANFMAVALMARDPQVTHKEWVLPLAAGAYLAGSWGALGNWCAGVSPGLERLLGRTLLALNCLILAGPLARVFDLGDEAVWLLLGAAFYAGFLLMAWTVVRFTRTELSAAALADGRVPWFFGVTLTTTYLQVFLWEYGFMGHLPRVETYAPMMTAAGGLVLYGEQCSRSFRKDAPLYGKDSFLGYAVILLGLFMAASQPQIRSLSLALAGVIWLAQALFRKELRHAWIAATLLTLAGASVASWNGFPGPWIPGLGLALALTAQAGGGLARRWWDGLAEVAWDLQGSILGLTAAAAVLAQWHYGSPPLPTAGMLVITAALFARRAAVGGRLSDVHAAAVTPALALPYLGLVDLTGRSLQGNNMAFGLALLSLGWATLVAARPSPLLRRARSTVLLVYGMAALSALCLRVAFEQGRPEDLASGSLAMSLGGPLLMAAMLVLGAYYSRSLLFNLLASLIVIILLPSLRREIQACFPFIEWGSGLMSGLTSAALAFFSCRLKASAVLADAEGADLFQGKQPFPLRRSDASLFTWPLLASAFFLAVKVDGLVLPERLAAGVVPLKTAAGLAATGLAWVLLAAYFRRRPWAPFLGHLAWACSLAGLGFGYWAVAQSPGWREATLLCGTALDALYVFYRFGLVPGRPWAGPVLADPLREVVRAGTVLIWTAAMGSLIVGGSLIPLTSLLAFLVFQLCWLALADGESLWGGLLFLGVWNCLAAWASPRTGPLLERASSSCCLLPTLWLFTAVQAGSAALEGAPGVRGTLSPLAAPALFLASLGALGAGILGLLDPAIYPGPAALYLSIALLFLTARGQASAPFALLGVLSAFRAVCPAPLPPPGDWRLAALALALSGTGLAAESVRRRWPGALSGRYAQGFFTAPARPWLTGPALGLAALSMAGHALNGAMRGSPLQLWTPYLAAAAVAVSGLCWDSELLFAAACLCLAAANIHAVRLHLGLELRLRGLMENHLLCLGLSATLAQFSLARRLLPGERARVFLNRTSLAAAGLVLALLATTYFLSPNLEIMTGTRFLLSGLMAFLAGRYFQRAAREPDDAERPFTALWEGLYHFAVTTALWCAALLLPALRNPNAAFPALGLPVLYFYLRAEISPREDDAAVSRYRNTAAALAFLLLLLYAFRSAFQMVMFPNAPVGVDHYHVNAPYVMALALVMFRLHALGATPWLAFYGGLAMVAGSYFALTALPGLSPFRDPIPAAWCAFVSGHFWMLFSARPSPPRALIQRLGGVGDEHWDSLRRSWGWALLAATQAALLLGLSDSSSRPLMAAPLLLGAATLLAHQGLLRRWALLFYLAGLEALAALHADFFLPSFLPREHVVWALLGTWSLFLGWAQLRPQGAVASEMGRIACWLAAATLGQVLYHAPGLPVGLWAFGLGTLLAALTPRAYRQPATRQEKALAELLLAAPVWLVYFSQRARGGAWWGLSTIGALLLTACFASWVQERYDQVFSGLPRPQPRLFDQLLSALAAEGQAIAVFLLFSVFGLTAGLQALHYGRPFDPHSLALILWIYAASAWAWFHEGRRRKSSAAYVLLQLCALGFFSVVRRQLMLTLNYWNYEYDVWASLLVSYSLAAARQLIPADAAEARLPLAGTLLAMPAAAMGWVMIHGLGTDMTLMVVGLYSLLFAFLGKDEEQSPYRLIAVAGFVSFVVIVFWTKLELRVLQAYVIPVGLGVLALLQLFRDRVSVTVRNEVRAVTLVAMLGSSGYYALTDERYPAAFHMTLLALSVFSMCAGSFLRVRLYILLGFAGALVDLAALLQKVLMHMERGARMTLIGGQVLAFGALLICGAIVYKTREEEIKAKIEAWRVRLRTWE